MMVGFMYTKVYYSLPFLMVLTNARTIKQITIRNINSVVVPLNGINIWIILGQR